MEENSIRTSLLLKGVTMKLKTILFTIVILSAVFLSAFGSPGAPQTAIKLQETVQPPAVTLVPPTVVVVTTPGVIPVTGDNSASMNMWALVLFGLLGLLGLAFLVALFSRRTAEPVDHIHPHDHDV
jgi:hypothetical protein